MSSSTTAHAQPIDIGTRLEPLIDDFLIAELDDSLDLRLNPPVKREVVLQTDAPCEGNACLYRTVFQDSDGRIRMYYGAWHYVMGGGRIELPPPLLCLLCREQRRQELDQTRARPRRVRGQPQQQHRSRA